MTIVTRQDILGAMDEEIIGIKKKVSFALTSKDLEARFGFGMNFRAAEESITVSIAAALAMLSVFTFRLENSDHDRIRVIGVMFAAMNFQLSSFKLFMCGHTVASGALFRQVIEGVSLGLLFSVRSLDFLARFESGQYSANNAVQDLRRRARDVHVRNAALETLLDAYRFYHTYAHLSKLTLAASANFARGGAPQIGALYDQQKVRQYAKEVKSRVSFARQMPNAVHGICRNLALW